MMTTKEFLDEVGLENFKKASCGVAKDNAEYFLMAAGDMASEYYYGECNIKEVLKYAIEYELNKNTDYSDDSWIINIRNCINAWEDVSNYEEEMLCADCYGWRSAHLSELDFVWEELFGGFEPDVLELIRAPETALEDIELILAIDG